MALTVSTGAMKGRGQDVWGSRRVSHYQVTGDSSPGYPTGGWAFDPKQFGHVGKVEFVVISPRFSSGATGTIDTIFSYDHANKKIFAYVADTGAQVSNGTDKSACVLDVLVFSD